jgi:hypothetical protein
MTHNLEHRNQETVDTSLEQIRDEKDSKKMRSLVVELDRLLESEDKSRTRPH